MNTNNVVAVQYTITTNTTTTKDNNMNNNNNNNDDDNNSTHISEDNVTQQLTEVTLSNNRLLMSTSVVGRETIN